MSKASDAAEEQIRALLRTSNRAVERALVVLYNRQTASEQATDSTSESNGVGFNAMDATLLSSFAKQVIQNRRKRDEGFVLSAKQHEIAREKLVKYARQLVQAAQEKIHARVMATPPEPPVAPVTRETKPCFIDGCPNDREPEMILCATHLQDKALVDRLVREQFGHNIKPVTIRTFIQGLVR